MKKILYFSLFLIALLLPLGGVSAAGLSIGSECKSNSDCQTNQCENSAKTDPQGKTLAYCVCGEFDTSVVNPAGSPNCASAYGGVEDDWTCKDGANLTWDLNYCLNKDIDKTKFPIPTKQTGKAETIVDMILDSSAVTAKMFSEIENIVQTPQPKITIPGLSFSEPKTIKEPAGTFLYIPFIGEYIASIYKYLIIVAGIIAVAMIINAAFGWVMSAGEAAKITQAKTRIGQSLMGLLIAVASYFILYFINPELVEFRNLRVRFVEPKPLEFETTGDTEDQLTEMAFSAPNIYCPKPSIGDIKYIPQILEPLKTQMYYRFGGKGGSPPYKEKKPEYLPYNNSCPGICLDCSGFVNFVLKCAGLPAPGGGTGNIFDKAELVQTKSFTDDDIILNGKSLKIGDLVGWKAGESDHDIGHVLMYVGKGKLAESHGGKTGREKGSFKQGKPGDKIKKAIKWVKRASF